MAAIYAFMCTCCGEVREGSPSFGYREPWQYSTLSADQKATMGTLDSDLCTITHDEATDYFIRTILEISIDGVSEPFTWGVWVSVSETSFMHYVETCDSPVEGDGFFGWLCNRLPGYPDTLSLPTDARVELGRQRPSLHLHHGSTDSHPLVHDQLHGISATRAQELAELITHGATS